MDDTFFVSELQPLGGLKHVVDSFGDREWAILLHQCRKVLALDVFHDQEVGTIGLVGIVGGDDIRMAELGRRLHFSLEAGCCQRILGDRRRQHLDRHDSLHAAMLGLEHLPHPARPDLVDERVVAQDQRLDFACRNLLGLELASGDCS